MKKDTNAENNSSVLQFIDNWLDENGAVEREDLYVSKWSYQTNENVIINTVRNWDRETHIRRYSS
jgi:hypothetical protein